MNAPALSYTKTLDYYDGIQLFEAKDPIGGHYIATLISTEGGHDRYLVVGCEPALVHSLKVGVIDLRSLIQQSAGYGWFFADISNISRPFELIPQEGSVIPTELLPDDGLYIFDADLDYNLIYEAEQRNSVIVQFAIAPPEASEDLRIRAATLSGLVNYVQNLTKYAVRYAFRQRNRPGRLSDYERDAHLLDTIMLSPGSAKVTFQAVQFPDLLGHFPLIEGLRHIDKMFQCADDPAQARTILEPYKGHMAATYIKLLSFVEEHQTGISYTWASPQDATPSHHAIPHSIAANLASRLASATDLSSEHVVLEGMLKMADEPNRRWRVMTEDGESSGVVRESGPSLSHLTIDEIYRFECIEEVEIVDASLRERHTLYLQSITHL